MKSREKLIPARLFRTAQWYFYFSVIASNVALLVFTWFEGRNRFFSTAEILIRITAFLLLHINRLK